MFLDHIISHHLLTHILSPVQFLPRPTTSAKKRLVVLPAVAPLSTHLTHFQVHTTSQLSTPQAKALDAPFTGLLTRSTTSGAKLDVLLTPLLQLWIDAPHDNILT